MRNEEIIDDLFEAARTESALRTMSSVREFVQNIPASTSLSLVIKWLKRNKMNMLISTSGLIITATILLFPKQEAIQKNVLNEVIEMPEEEVPIETYDKAAETTVELTKKVEEPQQEVSTLPEEENHKSGEKEVEEVPQKTVDMAATLVAKKGIKEDATPSYHIPRSTPKESKVTEHLIVLESSKGRASAQKFDKYLNSNLAQLSHAFSSSATKSEIRKFTLKLDNGYQADFQMQVVGFEKLELHWATDADGQLKDLWFRLDSGEINELDFSKSSKFSVKLKHKHQEF